ncbi:hypothetical protein ABTL53_19905, partial [Acinetobacter baumannii]
MLYDYEELAPPSKVQTVKPQCSDQRYDRYAEYERMVLGLGSWADRFVMDGPLRYREPSGPGGNPCGEIDINGKAYQECS